MIDTIRQNIRYALRLWTRRPAFAAVAILTLALGIGANTAIFSVINAIMLRPLPVERPTELISLETVYPDSVESVFSYAAQLPRRCIASLRAPTAAWRSSRWSNCATRSTPRSCPNV